MIQLIPHNEMFINSRKIWRFTPQINVVPELESDYRSKQLQNKMFVRTNAPAQLQRP